jgi:Fic family protein
MPISPLKYAHCEYPLPVRHRPKVPFHPRVSVPPALSDRSLEIHHLDRELDRFILREADYLDLVTDAFSSNIHYSSKLEGNPLPLDEVRRLAKNSLEGATVKKPDGPRQEIINHLLAWTQPQALGTPWSKDTLRQVHRYLTKGVEEEADPGRFRDHAGVITGPRGEGHFVTAPEDQIVPELDSLLEWLNRTAPSMLPEVAAALFFHEFESIHPFTDGNGRTGRTLFHAYLQNHGLKNSSLCLIEAKLTGLPELYYRILGWTDFSGGYLELVDFFTEALLDSYREAVERFKAKDLASGRLDELSTRLLVSAKRHGSWFSVREATAWISGRGEQTVRNSLNALVGERVLRAEGKTAAKRYRFADPLAALADRRATEPTWVQSVLLEDAGAPPTPSPRAKSRSPGKGKPRR